MGTESCSRKESSTAFFSHCRVTQAPFSGSATRNLPASRPESAASTASRISPVVAELTVSRLSQAASIVSASLLLSIASSPWLTVASPRALHRRRMLAEPADEIVGHVMDMIAGILGHGPFLAGQHQHRGHSQGGGRAQIARQILDHGGAGGIDPVAGDQAAIAGG